ncbi:hypothetical protein BLNAU_4038 [Blattamonas nauphoetae]|uniref:Uncharacterized protein n=1 Tax=Blattamonas nauphoetae TaxID=2049346 RepID=A0ABQ9YBB0_9EUKA|nr:hypothetical protein BLNAU_4038 [Blattamonas nauphoetae]
MKLQPLFDDTLEAKAVRFLTSVQQMSQSSARAFLGSFASTPDDSSTDFVESIVVLISSADQIITAAAMNMLMNLITTLNPLSLSFTETVDIHTFLITVLSWSVWLSTPNALRQLGIEDDNKQQAVHATVLTQVLAPSETYICRHLLEIFPCYRPTLKFVLNTPVFLTIPSCLTYFENDSSIMSFLFRMNNVQRDCKEKLVEQRQIWKERYTLLRMEGLEDVIEEKLRNDRNGTFGRSLVADSIERNNMQGMNLPELE